MGEPISANELSPLDQIRLAESEVTRKMVAAHEASESRVAEIRTQATLLKKQARESGEHKGQLRYKEVIAESEEEAHATLVQAHGRADELHKKGNIRMERAIQEAVRIILGTKGGGKINEP